MTIYKKKNEDVWKYLILKFLINLNTDSKVLIQ